MKFLALLVVFAFMAAVNCGLVTPVVKTTLYPGGGYVAEEKVLPIEPAARLAPITYGSVLAPFNYQSYYKSILPYYPYEIHTNYLGEIVP
ncbi:hypothetical protein HHI36_001966 [Cryptolaemus montrouzieri]|uniref:Uncharacterized protein n=1 Tax=Cryptolaemus montrouzieri TaxID=559131 RepID=A0ABD2P9Y5_9CUCU